MPLIHNLSEIELKKNESPINDFSWKSSLPVGKISKSKYLTLWIRGMDYSDWERVDLAPLFTPDGQ